VEFPPDPPDRPVRDAATVIVLREADDGLEIFMVRRHEKIGFMGGAFVFPGGKLDPEDADPRLFARVRGHDPESAARALGEPDHPERAVALHVAAVRETWEESGLLLAEGPAAPAVREARRALEAGTPFTALVEQLDATLRIDRLVPYARWITPTVESRRYDTRFFLTTAPSGQEARHDGSETTEGAWLRPQDALAREDRGEIFMAPPTVRTLRLLAGYSSPQAALDEAAVRTPPLVRPVFAMLDGVPALTLPGDPAHPEAEPVLAGATRIVLVDGKWRDTGVPAPT